LSFGFPMYPRKIVITAIFAGFWVVTLSFGMRALLSYENAPGKTGTVPNSWPAASTISRNTEHFTLVMLVHPRCPCTRASIGELAQLIARTKALPVDTYVLFWKPKTGGADWGDTELRRSAAQIPGVHIVTDIDGREARLFGAETSGHTELFDPSGNRVFSGGITASRGHAGDNPGETAIESLIKSQSAKNNSTLVFGCSLTAHPTKNDMPCHH
jgi:hypothetical protein